MLSKSIKEETIASLPEASQNDPSGTEPYGMWEGEGEHGFNGEQQAFCPAYYPVDSSRPWEPLQPSNNISLERESMVLELGNYRYHCQEMHQKKKKKIKKPRLINSLREAAWSLRTVTSCKQHSGKYTPILQLNLPPHYLHLSFPTDPIDSSRISNWILLPGVRANGKAKEQAYLWLKKREREREKKKMDQGEKQSLCVLCCGS